MNSSLTKLPAIFDRALHKKFISKNIKHFQNHSFLFDQVSANTLDFLNDISADFSDCLIYGFFTNTSLINAKNITLYNLIECQAKSTKRNIVESIICDEEDINLHGKKFDLIISHLSLHFINDVPGVLTCYLDALKPGGLFIANLFGDFTLQELRNALGLADLEYYGGVFPRISPMISSKSAAELMQRSGFANSIIQNNRITVYYSSIKELLNDIRFSRQSNCMYNRANDIPPKTFFKTAEKFYKEQYQTHDGKIPATFDIISLHGFRDRAM